MMGECETVLRQAPTTFLQKEFIHIQEIKSWWAHTCSEDQFNKE
jgi:hypothetical protein